MSNTVFYKKVGRKYIPVAEYDSELIDSFPKGNHLVMTYPGGSSTRYNIDPNYAALIAAGRVAEDAVCQALYNASELRMRKEDRTKPMTQKQKEAWENLVKEFGESARQLEWASAREMAEMGVKAMMDEAQNLMQNESVRIAYENFILMCKLSKNSD